ncbi:hypothetical protein CCR90_01885 [Rhodovulum sulfidophilum]|nr:hypothetical protein [Rhodovulum sulfidophilum]
MLTAQLGHGHPALRLAQHAHDLGFGETALLHRNLLVHPAEKILRSHPPNHGEDYPSTFVRINLTSEEAVAAVPLPAGLPLLLSGLLGIGLQARRKKAA